MVPFFGALELAMNAVLVEVGPIDRVVRGRQRLTLQRPVRRSNKGPDRCRCGSARLRREQRLLLKITWLW